MTRFLSKMVDVVIRNRKYFPPWLILFFEKIARNPYGFWGRNINILLAKNGHYKLTTVPKSPIRLYISPTNYAGQAFMWARAVENFKSGIGASNLEIRIPGGYQFESDAEVDMPIFNTSNKWADQEYSRAIEFSHVLIEAERPMFGVKFNQNLEKEIQKLREENISVAFMCHGTDVRDPDLHSSLTPWSPYIEDPRTVFLREDVIKNKALIHKMSLPVFVSTPDLLLDIPTAYWCPVVIDIEKFVSNRSSFSSPTPLVVHLSSNPHQKGTLLIMPILEKLKREALIDFEVVTSAKSSEIPELLDRADIVLDQFRSGSYGTAACEAMAAGRVVIGHVIPQVREAVQNLTGLSLPILEATPDTLEIVLREVVLKQDWSKLVEVQGRDFVSAIHSGGYSARQLIYNWIG